MSSSPAGGSLFGEWRRRAASRGALIGLLVALPLGAAAIGGLGGGIGDISPGFGSLLAGPSEAAAGIDRAARRGVVAELSSAGAAVTARLTPGSSIPSRSRSIRRRRGERGDGRTSPNRPRRPSRPRRPASPQQPGSGPQAPSGGQTTQLAEQVSEAVGSTPAPDPVAKGLATATSEIAASLDDLLR